MISVALGIGVVVGATLTLLSEFVVWKLWSQGAPQGPSIRGMPDRSVILIDPVVASIVCPLTLDIIFAIKWTTSCEFLFVFSITMVSVILYTSSLIVAYKLIAIFLPCNENNLGKLRENVSALSFCFSVVANVVTSVIMQVLGPKPDFDVQYLEAETCWTSSVRNNYYFVVLPFVILQFVQVLCYGCLRHFSDKAKLVNSHPASSSVISNVFVLPDDDNMVSTVSYSVFCLCCLFMTNILRLSFTICSCHLYVLLASGVCNICWLIVFKLPLTYLLYWTASRCLKKRF